MQEQSIALRPDLALRYYPAFLSAEQADASFACLLQELSFEQRNIVMFGKLVAQPRLIAWAGALPYRYSGRTLERRDFTPEASRLLSLVNSQVSQRFNHMLANLYRDGNDSMGMHADDEPELGPNPVVATLSLGATRRLSIRSKPAEPVQRVAIDLHHGSLLLMPGAMQARYHHGIGKQVRCKAPRLSLTLREILAPSRR